MQRPGAARIGAKPQYSVTYWTADAEASSLIKAWLEEETDRPLTFYGSFINWCSQQSDGAKSSFTKYQGEEDRQHTLNVTEVLREEPLDIDRFVGLMEDFRSQHSRGVKSGVITHPEAEDTFELKKAQEYLRTVVWTKEERDAKLVAEGKELSWRSKNKLARQQQAEAKKAEMSALGQWSETRHAVGEVEGQMEIDDTAAAMSQVEIAQKQPWESDLADRTKE